MHAETFTVTVMGLVTAQTRDSGICRMHLLRWDREAVGDRVVGPSPGDRLGQLPRRQQSQSQVHCRR